MSKPKCTPGPWTAEHNKRTQGFSIVASKCNWQLASVSLVPTDISGGAKRNAQLIAAAPDLYDALRGLERMTAELIGAYIDTQGTPEEPCWLADLIEASRWAYIALGNARDGVPATSATAPYTAPAEPSPSQGAGEAPAVDLEG